MTKPINIELCFTVIVALHIVLYLHGPDIRFNVIKRQLSTFEMKSSVWKNNKYK